MSRTHKVTTPRRKAKGRIPAIVRVPFRCLECGRVAVHDVLRAQSTDDHELKCKACSGATTMHVRIQKRIERIAF